MKAKWRISILVLAVVLGLAGLIAWRTYQRPKLYRVTVLPSLGGAFTVPFALNDRGQVVGYSQTADGDVHPFLWDRERGIEDLGDLNRGQPSGRLDINNAGQIAGTVRTSDEGGQAFIRDPNGAMRLLGDLGGGSSEAAALNNHGQVAGISTAADGSRHVCIWDQAGGTHAVLAFAGTNGHVYTINDAGLVWGFADTPTQQGQLFIWDPEEGLVATQTLPTQGLSFCALNNHSSFLSRHRFRPGGLFAVLWHRKTGLTKLWRLEGDIDRPALVNDVNQVVCREAVEPKPLKLLGKAIFRNRSLRWQLIVWDREHGRVVLDDQIPRGVRKNFVVWDFNNAGVILGQTFKVEKSSRAVLLEPIRENWGD